VAERSDAWVYSRSPAGIVGSNLAGGMDVCLLCCVLSGRGLSDRLITRPEESYRLWRVVVCDLETSGMRRLRLAKVVNAGQKKIYNFLRCFKIVTYLFQYLCRNLFEKHRSIDKRTCC
jgi:hypothetical protein